MNNLAAEIQPDVSSADKQKLEKSAHAVTRAVFDVLFIVDITKGYLINEIFCI